MKVHSLNLSDLLLESVLGLRWTEGAECAPLARGSGPTSSGSERSWAALSAPTQGVQAMRDALGQSSVGFMCKTGQGI